MTVDIEDLKKAFEILIEKIEKMGIKKIELDGDNYWVITSDERENFNTSEPDVCVGSLVDDYESLKKIISEENIATPVDFDRLASLIISLGEEIHKSKNIF